MVVFVENFVVGFCVFWWNFSIFGSPHDVKARHFYYFMFYFFYFLISETELSGKGCGMDGKWDAMNNGKFNFPIWGSRAINLSLYLYTYI
jgi:hypothetical protein